MLSMLTVLTALPSLLKGGLEVKNLLGEIVGSFKDKPQDQATLKQAIADLEAENDEGHARYQAKLAEAARR